MNQLLKIAALIGFTILTFPVITVAQIIPAADGTGTIVTPSSPTQNSQTRFDIQGGSSSADRANLFQSFEQFNLNTGETVNFISTPETRNILTRVTGGNISQIDGKIQVTGSNANLFLMNPAGIIFGENASLNVPASFFATTSTAMGLGDSLNGIPSAWFNAFTANKYSQLIGSPRGFVFSEESGTIINQANLQVAEGETIALVGNNVMNQGKLDAPNGNISIETVPENGWVRIRQAGNLLNLEVPSQTLLENAGSPIATLPKILTGSTQEQATTVQVTENGSIQLTHSDNINTVTRRSRITSESLENPNHSGISFVPLPAEILSMNTSEPILSRPFFPLNTANLSEIGSSAVELQNNSETSFSVPLLPQIIDRIENQPLVNSGLSSEPVLSISSLPFNRANLPEVEFRENFETQFSVPPLPLRVEDASIQPLPSYHFNPQDHAQLSTEQILTEASIREMLSTIEAQTNQKPAVIYAITHPEQLIEQIEGVKLQSQSGLTLMLVLPDGQPIVKSIPEVKLTKLRRVAREFYNEVSDPRTTGWPAARQLYQWLIAPLEPHLKEAGIDTLLFYLDQELRSIPLAALHDGQQFLIETYNFSLIPSLSLTNASYEGLQDAEVLAMGMSEFVDQPALPNVPTEILTITEKLWPGEALLNQAFTLENLQEQRSQQAFKIIHLATHANFNPQHNAYIQFWDHKLPLKQLRDLEWYKQPQVELLVLSACETGLGNTSETEMGFAGLAHQAGVKSALASLWQVSDVGTLGLMVEFYRNLKSSPIKAEALRQAQLALLRGGVEVEAGLLHSTRADASVSNTLAVRLQTRDLSHPYYWAGFTMIGSPW